MGGVVRYWRHRNCRLSSPDVEFVSLGLTAPRGVLPFLDRLGRRRRRNALQHSVESFLPALIEAIAAVLTIVLVL